MKQSYNILVTGCGGDIGQSIGKILNESDLFSKVVGADISEENAGVFIFENFEKVPSFNADNYLSEIQKLVEKYNIDIILPIAEPELRFFSDNHFGHQLFNCPMIMCDYNSMQVGFDKLATAGFLKKNNLNAPETVLITSVDSLPLPVLIKSRNGSGSKELFILENEEDKVFYKKKFPDFIAQELLGDTDHEYTCCVFRDKEGTSRNIILRRYLRNGFSVFGERVDNKEIEKYIIDIAEKLDLRGSINIQLRTTEKGPVAFEINPRFSSTVLFRQMMGFEDVIWSVQDRLGLRVNQYNKPDRTFKFYKGFNEYVK